MPTALIWYTKPTAGALAETKNIFFHLFFKTFILFLLVGLCAAFKSPVPKNDVYPTSLLRKFQLPQVPVPFDPTFLDRPDDSLSIAVPFNKIGNLIVLQASVDGVDGNFILDTGAPHLVLNQVYFRNYPVNVLSNEEHTSVSGTSAMIQKTTLKNFSIGGMAYHHYEADLVDLGQIENSKGIKVLGLIGYELLRNCEMIIDYEAGVIYFHRIGRREGGRYSSPHLQQPGFMTQEFEVQQSQILLAAQMNGKKLKFVLDSGAETGILDSRLPDSILDSVAVIGRMTIKGTGSKNVEALRGNASGLHMGGEALAPLPVLITNLEQTCFAQNMGVHGVVGLDFMKLKKIGFNFVTRKMYLWK